MCKSRIRVPEQWYGDYQAMLGAARVAERRLHELVARYGKETIKAFISEWFDYSERRMEQAIKRVPSGRLTGKGFHDPFPGVPDGYELKVTLDVDSEAGEIEVDLRDNIDCVPSGINSSMACAVSSVMQGLFSVLDPDVPHNAGSFRRVRVLLRENCIAGIPRFPHSCSLATNQPASRLINLIQSTFAQLGDGWGLAEGGVAQNVGYAVISGKDSRRGDASYINQINLANNGGPASSVCDGWLTYSIPVIAGLLYRDSVEIDEQRFPMRIHSLRIVRDSGGPGRFRGAPAVEVEYGPVREPMTIAYPAEGHHTPARGVCGGHDGTRARVVKVGLDGTRAMLPNVYVGELAPGEVVIGVDCSGGGYGDPFEREPARVLHDVVERWVSEAQATEVYGVVLAGSADDDSLTIDSEATASSRAGRAGSE
jgi:N-methylhydantoinase B